MKPLDKNPLVSHLEESPADKLCREELEAFMKSDAKWAELERLDDKCMIQTWVERYKKAARKAKVNRVSFHQRKGVVIACKQRF